MTKRIPRLLAAALVLALLGATVLALSPSPTAGAGVDDSTFEVPALWVGDKARYAHETNPRMNLLVQILPPEGVRNETQIQEAQVIDVRIDFGSFWRNETFLVAPASGETIGHRFRFDREYLESEYMGIIPAGSSSVHRTQLTRLGDAQPVPCGLWNPFQGTKTSPTQREAAPCGHHTGTWEAQGESQTGETRSVLFHVKDHRGVVLHEVVLRDDVPLPLRFTESGPWVLTAFERGSRPGAQDAITSVALPAMTYAPRTAWLVDDTDIEHPFRLSTAYQAALDDEEKQIRDFLRRHPAAYLHQVSYVELERDTEHIHAWGLTFGDGVKTVQARVEKRIPTARLPLLGPQSLEGTVHVEVQPIIDGHGEVLPLAQVPARIPRLADLVTRYVAMTGEEPQSYTFAMGCHGCTSVAYPGPGGGHWISAPPCTGADCTTWIQFSIGHDRGIVGGPSLDGVVTMRLQSHMIAFDASGAPYMESDTSYDARMLSPPTQAIEPATQNEPAGGWSAMTQVTSVAAWGAVAVGGAIALAWIVKGALAALFTRLERGALLEHPVRSRIHDAVQAEPGIHYQELSRRVGVAQGTLRHHLAALERGGVLRAVKGPRHTCYFAAGTTDRHTLTAAPLLRSDGARRVLLHAHAAPGLGTNELAAALGMSASTVHTHLKRLEAAGVVAGGDEAGRRSWRVVQPQVAQWAQLVPAAA
jgi:predicted transcriptional regulator